MTKDEVDREDINKLSIGVLSRIGADAALNLEKIVGSRKCVACFKIEDGITKYVYICGSDSVGTKKIAMTQTGQLLQE